MAINTEENKAQLLESLLGEARAEVDQLRADLEKYQRIIASTRLMMGHELKKPATAICGYLDLVCEDLEKANQLGTLTYAEKARAECGLLNELNQFYIELLKVDNGSPMNDLRRVNIGPFIGDIIEQFPAKHDARRRVEVNINRNVGPIFHNYSVLRLIIMNLIENALIYSQVRTAVKVEVEEAEDRRGMAHGRLLKILVTDDGVGIPATYIKRIFSPFIRLREDVAEGSGLGLTLVRSLVDLAGGEVYIESDMGQGTRVHVTLPLHFEAEDDPVILL